MPLCRLWWPSATAVCAPSGSTPLASVTTRPAPASRGWRCCSIVLGMSYGAVAIALGALGCPLSKVAVYNAVQEAGVAVAGLRREAIKRGGGRVVGLGADLTSV